MRPCNFSLILCAPTVVSNVTCELCDFNREHCAEGRCHVLPAGWSDANGRYISDRIFKTNDFTKLAPLGMQVNANWELCSEVCSNAEGNVDSSPMLCVELCQTLQALMVEMVQHIMPLNGTRPVSRCIAMQGVYIHSYRKEEQLRTLLFMSPCGEIGLPWNAL